MEKELDPEVIKATQTSLGKYVKRPPLTDKLLKKPPFRFLHDIVTTVLKTTGFFGGLFEKDELVSDNVKDRDSKIQFLNKVISVVGWTTGQLLLVKPSKIVAGQEADKTNELLQCLAQALDRNLSSDDAVKKYKENGSLQPKIEKKSKEVTKSLKKNNEKKLSSKSNENLITTKKESAVRSSKNEGEKANVAKTKHKDNESPPKKPTQQSKILTKKASLEKKIQPDVSKQQKIVEKNENENVKDQNGAIAETNIQQNPSKLSQGAIDSVDNIEIQTESPRQNLDNSLTIDNQLNSSLSSQELIDVNQEKVPETPDVEDHCKLLIDNEWRHDHKIKDHKLQHTNRLDNVDNNEQIRNEINMNDVASPKHAINENEKTITSYGSAITKSPIKNNNTGLIRPVSVRPSSSRPGAPRLRDKHENIIPESETLVVGKVNIIAENISIEEEEDSSLTILEQESNSVTNMQDNQEHLQLSTDQHGHLVQQILESQKEFSQMTGKTEIEWEFGAQKAREAVNKEIEQLRYNIQGLSRVANPLGKLLDHIQEDVEIMRQELQQWTTTYEDASKELSKQKTINEDSLFPLRSKVKQLNAEIVEKHDKINDLKIVIHKNSSRIEKLLASGDVQ